MERLKRYACRIPLIVAAVLAVALGNTAAASASPQDFPVQLMTMIQPNPAECLDVDLGTVGNARTNVHLWHCRSSSDPEQSYQLFSKQPIPGRDPVEFKLRNPRTNKCLTYNVTGGPGSPVWAESCDKFGQGWTANPVPNHSSESEVVGVETTGRCLDVQDPSGREGAGIDLWYCDGSPPYVRWDAVLFS
jgi:ricin-type beta-trefoil lectin protein